MQAQGGRISVQHAGFGQYLRRPIAAGRALLVPDRYLAPRCRSSVRIRTRWGRAELAARLSQHLKSHRWRLRSPLHPASSCRSLPAELLIPGENAIKHGIEPAADGGRVDVVAHREGDAVVVTVSDTGRGLAGASSPAAGGGVGLSNIRERLAALYGSRGRFTLEPMVPRGARATLAVPFETAS